MAAEIDHAATGTQFTLPIKSRCTQGGGSGQWLRRNLLPNMLADLMLSLIPAETN